MNSAHTLTSFVRRFFLKCTLLLVVFLATVAHADAQEEKTEIYPMAILPFSARGGDLSDEVHQMTDLLFVHLVTQSDLYLVERDDLESVLQEQELSLSGAVQQSQAVQVGQLTGAKILVTGSLLSVGSGKYIVAKIISSETGRVLGASVKGKLGDSIDDLTLQLAEKVGETIRGRGRELVAAPDQRRQQFAELRERLHGQPLPSLSVKVAEEHYGDVVIDPAVETEFQKRCNDLGLFVFEAGTKQAKDADYRIVGEAFSEFGTQRGNLISCKGRAEIKVIDNRTEEVIIADRQTAVAFDLSENIAAKSALQDAAFELVLRTVPKMLEKTDDQK